MGDVVFIVLDTLRRDKVSVYNEKIDFTQNLESFSSEATVFEDAVAQAPWTLPSHASMFTGLYPWEHGATEKKLFLDVDQELLAEKFSENGYNTACFSANPWIADHTGLLDGFQEINNQFPLISDLPGSVKALWKKLGSSKKVWLYGFLEKFGEPFMSFAEKGNSETEDILKDAREFVESSDQDFFLFLNLMDPHMPYFPPKKYKDKHAPDINPDEMCQVGYKHNAGIVEADFEALEKLYNAEVDYMDDALGEFIDFLDKETTVVIVSDHGEHLGEFGLIDHQFSVSEKLVNIPLMIKSTELNESCIDSQFELKNLYNLVPALEGLEETPALESKYALGGLEYPEMHLKNVPKDKREEFAKTLSFVRGSEKKLIRSKTPEVTEDKTLDLESGKQIKVDQEFVEKIEGIEEAEEGSKEIEEEVKERLEELGYM